MSRQNINITLDKLARYISETGNDKYCKGKYEVVDIISELNLNFNLGAAFKYIARFSAKSGNKTNNPHDLLKAAHYLLIEYSRLVDSNIQPTFKELKATLKIQKSFQEEDELFDMELALPHSVPEDETETETILESAITDTDQTISFNKLSL